MNIRITKSAREYGYIIWSQKTNEEMKRLLGDLSEVSIVLNGLSIGIKRIDWLYHRISIGYKFTRALPQEATEFNLSWKGSYLEVTAQNDGKDTQDF